MKNILKRILFLIAVIIAVIFVVIEFVTRLILLPIVFILLGKRTIHYDATWLCWKFLEKVEDYTGYDILS